MGTGTSVCRQGRAGRSRAGRGGAGGAGGKALGKAGWARKRASMPARLVCGEPAQPARPTHARLCTGTGTCMHDHGLAAGQRPGVGWVGRAAPARGRVGKHIRGEHAGGPRGARRTARHAGVLRARAHRACAWAGPGAAGRQAGGQTGRRRRADKPAGAQEHRWVGRQAGMRVHDRAGRRVGARGWPGWRAGQQAGRLGWAGRQVGLRLGRPVHGDWASGGRPGGQAGPIGRAGLGGWVCKLVGKWLSGEGPWWLFMCP